MILIRGYDFLYLYLKKKMLKIFKIFISILTHIHTHHPYTYINTYKLDSYLRYKCSFRPYLVVKNLGGLLLSLMLLIVVVSLLLFFFLFIKTIYCREFLPLVALL